MARLGLGVLAVYTLCGCRAPQKTLVINSQPPGATVWVNGEKQEGVTPVRIPFEWYGRTEVRLEKEGYASVARDIHIPTELDGYPVIDLVLLPFARDKTYPRTIRMNPIGQRPPAATIDALRERATRFKHRAEREVREPGTPQPDPEGPHARGRR